MRDRLSDSSRPLLSSFAGGPLHTKNLLSLEVLFVLFLFAGVYKSWAVLSWAPDLTAVFAILTSVAAVAAVVKNSLVDRRAIVLVIFWMLFVLYALISTFWSPSELYATEKIIELVSIVTLSIGVPAVVVARSRRRVARLFFAILAFAAIVAIAALVEFVKAPGTSLEPFGAVYLLVGRVVGFGFLISLYLTLFELRSRTNRTIGAMSTGVFGFVLLTSGGRGPLVAAVMAGVILTAIATIQVMIRSDIPGRTILRSVLIAGGISSLVGAGLAMLGVMPKTVQRLYKLVTGQRTTSFGARLEYYTEAVHQWTSSPLFGVGLGGWPVVAGWDDARGYPHNFVLEIAAELGIIGLVLFTILLLYSLAQIRPIQKLLVSPLSALLAALFVYMVLNASVTSDISGNRYLYVIVGLFATTFHPATSEIR